MFPAGLSMLWESCDAREALRERFGLEDFESAVGWLTGVLAELWGIEVRRCERILISDQNAIGWVGTDRGDLVVKWSRARDKFDRYAAVSELLHGLHGQGIAVAAPLASSAGRRRELVSMDASTLSMAVQPQVDGELLDTDDPAAVRAAGACLAQLHAALAVHHDHRLIESGPRPASELRQEIERWLAVGDAGSAPAASERLGKLLPQLPPLDAEQHLIHNDFRASNILTTGSEIVGVLDFDDVAWDYAVCDLARASVYLSTRFTNWQPTPDATRRFLLEGYQSVRPLSAGELQWLEVLKLWRGLQAIPPGPDPAAWARAV